MKPRSTKQMNGADLPLRLALYNETEGGDSEQRRQFWCSERVPEKYRGEELEGRPDPRAILTDNPRVLAAYREAQTLWDKQNDAWHRDRVNWLRRAAKKERT